MGTLARWTRKISNVISGPKGSSCAGVPVIKDPWSNKRSCRQDGVLLPPGDQAMLNERREASERYGVKFPVPGAIYYYGGAWYITPQGAARRRSGRATVHDIVPMPDIEVYQAGGPTVATPVFEAPAPRPSVTKEREMPAPLPDVDFERLAGLVPTGMAATDAMSALRDRLARPAPVAPGADPRRRFLLLLALAVAVLAILLLFRRAK